MTVWMRMTPSLVSDIFSVYENYYSALGECGMRPGDPPMEKVHLNFI